MKKKSIRNLLVELTCKEFFYPPRKLWSDFTSSRENQFCKVYLKEFVQKSTRGGGGHQFLGIFFEFINWMFHNP